MPRMSNLLIARYRTLSLRAKFAFPIAAGILLLFAALIPGVLYLQTRAVLEGARDRGLGLANVFAHSSVQALVGDDFLALRQIINGIASEPDVLSVMIMDQSGKLLAHSDMREAGRTYTDPVSRRMGVPCHVQNRWRGHAKKINQFLLRKVRLCASTKISAESCSLLLLGDSRPPKVFRREPRELIN